MKWVLGPHPYFSLAWLCAGFMSSLAYGLMGEIAAITGIGLTFGVLLFMPSGSFLRDFEIVRGRRAEPDYRMRRSAYWLTSFTLAASLTVMLGQSRPTPIPWLSDALLAGGAAVDFSKLFELLQLPRRH
jgi:hypothetical protein